MSIGKKYLVINRGHRLSVFSHQSWTSVISI